jgi:hypothetical protein
MHLILKRDGFGYNPKRQWVLEADGPELIACANGDFVGLGHKLKWGVDNHKINPVLIGRE